MTWFSLFLIFHVAAQVGIRKDEAASPFSDVLPKRRPTRAWLTWYYQGKFYPHLDIVQLANLDDKDAAVLMLPPSKADQHGLKWSASPYFLPFRKDAVICAARMFRDLEVRFPVPVFQRSQVPLFARSNGLPFTHTQLDQAIQSVMEVTMTFEQRRCHSFHSFRIYLCACLYRANASTERTFRECCGGKLRSLLQCMLEKMCRSLPNGLISLRRRISLQFKSQIYQSIAWS